MLDLSEPLFPHFHNGINDSTYCGVVGLNKKMLIDAWPGGLGGEQSVCILLPLLLISAGQCACLPACLSLRLRAGLGWHPLTLPFLKWMCWAPFCGEVIVSKHLLFVL